MKQEPLLNECRVALYARVSSDKQAKEGTIDSQLSALRERIIADGGRLKPSLEFTDDGVSGSTLVRPALERLRDQAAAGAIDRLYLLAPDRLARRHVHQMLLTEELQGYGVEVLFLNRPLGTTAEDQLLLHVQGIIGEYERAKIMERTRRGRLHAARCGRVSVMSKAPFGYRYVDKHQGGGVAAYEVVEDESQVVRQIFAWVGCEGCSLREVARRLEKLGVRTRHGRTCWNPATLRDMLRNPSYRGEAAFGRTRLGERRPRLRPRRGDPAVPKQPQSSYEQPASEHIGIAVPALVEANLFQAVQERLEENRRRLRQRRRGPRFLLSGLLLCSGCGYAIYGQGVHGRDYYRCLGRDARRFGGKPVCQNRTQYAADLDAVVWNDALALLNEPDRLRQEFARRQQRPDPSGKSDVGSRLQKTLTKIKQGISRLIDAYTEGLVESSEFEPRMRRFKERQARLITELETLQEQARQEDDFQLVFTHFQAFADQMEAGLRHADWNQRRDILRALVKRVEVGKEHIRIVYKVPPRPFVDGPQAGAVQHCLPRLAGSRPRVPWHARPGHGRPPPRIPRRDLAARSFWPTQTPGKTLLAAADFAATSSSGKWRGYRVARFGLAEPHFASGTCSGLAR
jgi:site-specific DNA recombinase